MRITRLLIALGLTACSGGCHGNSPKVSSAAPLRGDVTRDTVAAHANTERAYALIESGKYAEAEPLLRRAIEEDPNYGPAHNDLGIVHYHAERLYDAAWEFQNAVKLMPRQPEPHNNLGLVLESALRLEEAEQSYKQAHDLDPRNPNYAGNLAKLRLRMGRHEEETKRLLEIVVMADSRPDWVDWARFNLARLQTLPQDTSIVTPASQPAPVSNSR